MCYRITVFISFHKDQNTNWIPAYIWIGKMNLYRIEWFLIFGLCCTENWTKNDITVCKKKMFRSFFPVCSQFTLQSVQCHKWHWISGFEVRRWDWLRYTRMYRSNNKRRKNVIFRCPPHSYIEWLRSINNVI